MNTQPLRPCLSTLCCLLLGALLLAACEPRQPAAQFSDDTPSNATSAEFLRTGSLQSREISEASGLQAGAGGVYFVHDDERTRLFRIDETGRDLGTFKLSDSSNRDWEDLTRVPGPDGPLLVVGDIGDNHGLRRQLSLYFLAEPSVDSTESGLTVFHRLRFTYPDGPRDAEALAYDAAGERLLLLSKRDQPPRLYGLPLDLALWETELQAEFLGEVPGFRPPTRSDFLRNPGRGLWVSQPTGMDISPDGRLAAVITYRSLYLFERLDHESWVEALQKSPLEILGPPGTHDEAVAFSADGQAILVTAEGLSAPVWRLEVGGLVPEGNSDL